MGMRPRQFVDLDLDGNKAKALAAFEKTARWTVMEMDTVRTP